MRHGGHGAAAVIISMASGAPVRFTVVWFVADDMRPARHLLPLMCMLLLGFDAVSQEAPAPAANPPGVPRGATPADRTANRLLDSIGLYTTKTRDMPHPLRRTGYKIKDCYVATTGHMSNRKVFDEKRRNKEPIESYFLVGQANEPGFASRFPTEYVASGEDDPTDNRQEWEVAHIQNCRNAPDIGKYVNLEIATKDVLDRHMESRLLRCYGYPGSADTGILWQSESGKFVGEQWRGTGWLSDVPLAPGMSGGPCFFVDIHGTIKSKVVAQAWAIPKSRDHFPDGIPYESTLAPTFHTYKQIFAAIETHKASLRKVRAKKS